MYVQVLDDTATPIPYANVYETGAAGAYLGATAWGATTDVNGWVTVPEGLGYVTFSFAGSGLTYAGNAIPATVTIGSNQLNEIVITPAPAPKPDFTPYLIGAVLIAAIFFLIDKKVIG